MKYKAEITFDCDNKLIKKCFEGEQGNGERSNFKIEDTGNKVKFLADAEDSVALRATLNSITKLLTVYEKMAKIKGGK